MFSEYTDGVVGVNGASGSMPYASGWAALAKYDSNKDNVIDANDSIWKSLLIWVDGNHDGKSWVDANQNGIFDKGEVSELVNVTQMGISQIGLQNTPASNQNVPPTTVVGDNKVLNIGQFEMNGVFYQAVDVDFTSDQARHNLTPQANNGTLINSMYTNFNVSTVRTYFSGNWQNNVTLNATFLGVDNIYGGSGNEILVARNNGSFLVGAGGSNTYIGGEGNDVFVIGSGDKQENIKGGGGINTGIHKKLLFFFSLFNKMFFYL
jgi:Ca2+-binding RTX toxin-like protein